MNINRNNYEEFFLMYVDGELTPEQRQQIELFVTANSDLKEELQMLQQTMLSLDDEDAIFTFDKSALYKSPENAINTANAEEKMLLYVDNELNREEKAAVETFVLQNPAVQDNFTLLKQTKLPLEAVPYPNKEELYKEEEDEKPVIYMRWWKLAVAAIFITVAVTLWLLVPSKTTEVRGLATNTPKATLQPVPANNNNAADQTTAKDDEGTTVAPQETSIENNNASVASNNNNRKQKSIVVPAVKNETTPAQLPVTNNPVAQNNKIVITTPAAENKTIVPAPVAPVDNTTYASNNPKIKDPAALVPKGSAPSFASNNTDNATKAINTKADNNNTASIAQPAVYRVLNTDEDEDDRKSNVYISSIEINKQKLNGLFKKAKGIFKKDKGGDDDGPSSRSTSKTR